MFNKSLEWITQVLSENGGIIRGLYIAILGLISGFLLAYYRFRKERQLGVESAKREYETGARKSLYMQTEPLIFQLFDDSLHTVNRLNRLTNKNRWPSSYDYNPAYDEVKFSTYRILLPLLYHEIIKRKLTFLDLSLDGNRKLYIIYHLLLLYSWTFDDRSEFAKGEDPLLIARDMIHSSVLNEAINEMTIAANKQNHPDRPINFLEFLQLHDSSSKNPPSAIRKIVKFYRFDPMKRPILQRMMLAQIFLIYVVHIACVMTRPLPEDLRVLLYRQTGTPWDDKFENEALEKGRDYVLARLNFSKYLQHMQPKRFRWLRNASASLMFRRRRDRPNKV